MSRFVPGNAPEIDRLIESAIASIAAAIDSLRIPRLAGVVLGGGYGRGEGGVFGEFAVCSLPSAGDGGEGQTTRALSNDLDFYVVTEEGACEADIDRIGEMLKPVSSEWTAKLGVDVDFCRAKTPWRLRHDEHRLMVQELVHGYVDVCGRKGEELFAGVARLEPAQLPWNEAARLLVNRGVGLLLAAEREAKCGNDAGFADRNFINRNINKCVLGAGDARLIADGKYRWKIEERASALGDDLYSRAVEWKLHPTDAPVCSWEDARTTWLDAFAAVNALHSPRRALFHAVRWVARRRTLGDLATFGLDPEVRIMRTLHDAIEKRSALTDSLRKDWMVFN